MRQRLSFATICGILLTSLASGQAATGTKVFGLSGLAKQKGVQDELKMTKAQADGVGKLIQEFNDRTKDDFAKLKDLKDGERFKKEAELYKAKGDEANQQLTTLLGADKFKRLKQIHVQQRGPYAFTESETADALKLTKEQLKKLRDIQGEYQKALADAAKLTDANERTQKLTGAIKEALDKDLAVLSDDQKQTWKELTGPPYKGK